MKKFDPAVYKKRKCECLDKCFQAFMDNGLENTGLQLLCKYCGFKTNQALYHYFESKDSTALVCFQKKHQGFWLYDE